MYPYLQLPFGSPISTYGLFLALAHFFGIALLLTLVRRRGLRVGDYVDLIFVVIVSGLFGARLAYIYGHQAEFAGRWVHALYLWEGGLSFHGGFFFAFPAFLAFLYWKRLPILASADLAAPVLPLCMAIIRLGCFLAGCCFGLPTELPWGVKFHSDQVPPALAPLHLHPTQLYESFLLLTLGLFFLRELRKNRLPVGTLGVLSIFLYGWLRFGLDFLRGDLVYGLFGIPWLTFSQASAALAIVIGVPLLAWVWKRAG